MLRRLVLYLLINISQAVEGAWSLFTGKAFAYLICISL